MLGDDAIRREFYEAQGRMTNTRWTVARKNYIWIAAAPGRRIEDDDYFNTHAEAIAYAHRHATIDGDARRPEPTC